MRRNVWKIYLIGIGLLILFEGSVSCTRSYYGVKKGIIKSKSPKKNKPCPCDK